jgi:hypothetical protein
MRLLTIVVGILCASCSSNGVAVDRDPNYDFSVARTYAWTEGLPAASDLHEKRIVQGVDAALAGCGLERATTGAPDLLVSTEVQTRHEVRSSGSAVGIGIGGGFQNGSVGVGTTVGDDLDEVEVGTLVIALRDGKTEQLVWRAEAEDVVTSDPEDTAEAIREAIHDAFEEFPRARSER